MKAVLGSVCLLAIGAAAGYMLLPSRVRTRQKAEAAREANDQVQWSQYTPQPQPPFFVNMQSEVEH